MAYISSDDLKIPIGGNTAFIEAADLDGDGAVDPTVVTQVIARAQGIVDGFLGSRYAVPLASPSDLVKNITLDIARWFLYSNRGMGDLELARRNYHDALSLLKDIAAGRMQIGVAMKPTGSETVTAGGIITPATFDDGGPFWDDDWRGEGTTDDERDDGL